MTTWLFVPQMLTHLSRGAFFRKIFFYLFRATAVITALLGLGICAGALTAGLRLPGIALIAALIFIAITAVAFYAAAHIYWLRAVDIRDLPDGPLTMIPIVAIMLRTVGEVLAVLISVMSVGLFVLLLLAGEEAGAIASQVPGLPSGLGGGGNPFIAGVAILAFGCILSLVQLAYFYLIAELVGVLAQIATNTGVTASNTTLMLASGGTPFPFISPIPRAAVPVTPTHKVCGSCGMANPLGSAFCENCGKPL